MRIRTGSMLRIQRTPKGYELYDPISGQTWDDKFCEQIDLLAFLLTCDKASNFAEMCSAATQAFNITEEDASALINELIEVGLLELIKEDPKNSWIQGQAYWKNKNWDASYYFHLVTNYLPKDNLTEDPRGFSDKDMMRNYVTNGTMPSAYKDYNTAQFHILPDWDETKFLQSSLEEIFQYEVSKKKNLAPWSQEELSWFMKHTFGQTGIRRLPITGDHISKTSPSGGSRHPVECYVFIFDIAGVPAGLYHYSVRKHGLELLKEGLHSDFFQDHVITHPNRPGFPIQFGLVLSIIPDRSMFRYRESRSYRVMQLDQGHLLQTCAFAAARLGRPSYRAYSLHDNKVEEFIGLDPILEPVMSFAAIG